MRMGMRRLASGVSVVTGRDKQNNRLAMTASSITSLSDEPPSLLVCIHKNSYLKNAILETGVFCINLLAADQQDISVRCASPDESLDRFALGEWEKDSVSGIFYLKQAQAIFHCAKTREFEYGTHFIFVGDIQAVVVEGQQVNPLIYLNGRYVQAVE